MLLKILFQNNPSLLDFPRNFTYVCSMKKWYSHLFKNQPPDKNFQNNYPKVWQSHFFTLVLSS